MGYVEFYRNQGVEIQNSDTLGAFPEGEKCVYCHSDSTTKRIVELGCHHLYHEECIGQAHVRQIKDQFPMKCLSCLKPVESITFYNELSFIPQEIKGVGHVALGILLFSGGLVFKTFEILLNQEIDMGPPPYMVPRNLGDVLMEGGINGITEGGKCLLPLAPLVALAVLLPDGVE